jgi:hypothetical protein
MYGLSGDRRLTEWEVLSARIRALWWRLPANQAVVFEPSVRRRIRRGGRGIPRLCNWWSCRRGHRRGDRHRDRHPYRYLQYAVTTTGMRRRIHVLQRRLLSGPLDHPAGASTCVTLKSAANFAIAFVGSGSLVVRTKPASLHPIDLKSPLPPSLSVPNQVLGQAVGLIVERRLREPQQFIQQVTEPRHLFREPNPSLFNRQRSG